MFQTKIQLANPDKIDSVLKEIVRNSYEEVREERLLLCMECGDVDLYIAASNHEELQDAINENFEIDECGEIIKLEEHQQLMDDLYEYFLKLHRESNLFDFFLQVIILWMGKVVNRKRICWDQKVYFQRRLKML